MEASAVEIRLRNHDQRIQANHDSLSSLRSTSATHSTQIAVINTEHRETREDIADIKRDLAAARAEQKSEMTWIRRGLWAAAASFMMFFFAAASLLVQVAGS
jgi:septal ring factor EnvC (AmiA/AmiB activator)